MGFYDVKERVPKIYRDNPNLTDIYQAVQPEIDSTVDYLKDTENQLFMSTATDRGLKVWEAQTDLNGIGLTIEQRRQALIDKKSQRIITTKPLMERLISDALTGSCVITEHIPDYYYTVEVSEADLASVLAGLSKLKKIMVNYNPCHLGYEIHITASEPLESDIIIACHCGTVRTILLEIKTDSVHFGNVYVGGAMIDNTLEIFEESED